MIEIRNLWKRFDKLQVFSGLDLDVKDGETIVILGPSGIGKSVLLKHIIGLLKPDKGTIDVQGVRITDLEGPALLGAIQNMGMLFQGAALFDSMDVGENTAFYLTQHGDPQTGARLSKSEIEGRVAHALKVVGLRGQRRKCRPSSLGE